MGQLKDLKYDGEGCVRVHIAKMLDIGNRLRSLDVNVDEAMMQQDNKKEREQNRVNAIHDIKGKPKSYGKTYTATGKARKHEEGKEGKPVGLKLLEIFPLLNQN
ncbi:unnamed protein product [Prunus armeniaca]